MLTVVVLSLFCFSFAVSALKVDGVMNDSAWLDSYSTVFISSSDVSNCDADFASVSVLSDKKSNQLLFGFKVELNSPIENSTDYGVAVSINSGEFIYVTADGVSGYDAEKYSLEGAARVLSDKAFVSEVIIGVKYGLSSVDTVEVRVVDSHGMPSTVFSLDSAGILSDLTAEETSEKSERTSAKKKSTTKKYSKKTKQTTAESITENTLSDSDKIYNNYFESNQYVPYDEQTTVLTMEQIKVQRGFSYAAVAALILLALGICVVVNVKHDKNS